MAVEARLASGLSRRPLMYDDKLMAIARADRRLLFTRRCLLWQRMSVINSFGTLYAPLQQKMTAFKIASLGRAVYVCQCFQETWS